MKRTTLFVIVVAALLIATLSVTIVDAQGPKPGTRAPSANAGTAFTYQGQLKNGGAGVNGACDIVFGLYDAPTGGNQIGYAVGTPNPTTVTNGLFTVQVDFGSSVIKGDSAWLLVSVRCPASSGNFVMLDPRQPLTPAPMALALPGLYTQQNATSPNIIGGYSSNVISPTVVGGTISGGGAPITYDCGLCMNRVTDDFGVISGGRDNQAGNNNASTTDNRFATVGGGSGNKATGEFATIPGGYGNEAKGFSSFAAGKFARANADGVFVWADSVSNLYLSANVPNSFIVRASGGITMYTSDAGTGVRVLPGSGTWSSASDKNVKANFATVNSRDILARVNAMPIQTWNYQAQDATIRHIGPMAQDFYAVFKVGEDDTHITTIDADGVALAAIQGLSQENQELEAQVASITSQNVELESQVANLEARLAALEQNTQANNPVNSNTVAMIVVGALLGIVIAPRLRRGER